MLNEIIANLGANYKSEDSSILQGILDNTISSALFISNRKNTSENIDLLKNEIIECTISKYLQRGTEDVTNLSQSGLSSTFKNAEEKLRNDIVRNGKRIIK